MVPNDALASPADETGATPAAAPRVLLVGVDPALVDFRTLPGLTAAGVRGARSEIDAELSALGLTVERCVLDLGATAEATLRRALGNGDFACVVIGAGVRVVPENLPLFERVVNTVHRLAPDAAIAFNTDPADTADAVRRALAAPRP
ncbi:hypothetical protein [Streptomyces marincola]|uniref:hypothetical protein n=1 Tax=Streptomyces marincola TaxID=2878388 RepID=UPI001CF48285|nr:hypothetical protein [Streptomyces marincola]UCM87947.1 hypothetical protein LC193_08245 [Streptomyces marincola]